MSGPEVDLITHAKVYECLKQMFERHGYALESDGILANYDITWSVVGGDVNVAMSLKDELVKEASGWGTPVKNDAVVVFTVEYITNIQVR